MIWDFAPRSGYEGHGAEDFLAFSVIGWVLDPRGFFNYILGIETPTGDSLPAVALSDENGDQIGIAANPLVVSLVPGGTQDVNLTQVGSAPISEGNAVPTQISVDHTPISGANPLPMTQFSGGVAVPAGSLADPLRVDPTGTTPQPVSGTVEVSGTPAVNLSQFGGVAASAVNPIPVQAALNGSVASATNPLPAQLSVSGTAATAANPVPVQSSVGGAVVSTTNPIPVQQYTAAGVAVPAGTSADPSYAFPGARTDAAATVVQASRAFVVGGQACDAVLMRDYAAVVWTILPTNLGANTTLTITILSQSATFVAGESLATIGKVLADPLLSSSTVAAPTFALMAYTPTVSTTSVATLVVNQPIKIYCTKRDLYMGISVAGTAADGTYTVTALRMV